MTFKLTLIAMILLSTAGASAAEVKVVFDHAVEITNPTAQGLGPATPLAAGKELTLPNDRIVWVQHKGFVPVLVVPASTFVPGETAKIRMPEVAAWPPVQIEQEIEFKVGRMMDEMMQFQNAIMRKDVREAEAVLSRMESTVNVPYLNFLRATLEFVKGDLASARASVKRGLKRYPANEQGQKLLKAIGEPQE